MQRRRTTNLVWVTGQLATRLQLRVLPLLAAWPVEPLYCSEGGLGKWPRADFEA